MMGLFEKNNSNNKYIDILSIQNICIHVETTGFRGWNVLWREIPQSLEVTYSQPSSQVTKQNHLDKGNPSKLSYPSNIAWFDPPP